MELINREEVIKIIKRLDDSCSMSFVGNLIINMPIIESSEDSIDRYAALAELEPQSVEYKIIKDLPSVVPSIFVKEIRPKGKWLRKEYNFDEWVDECSVCGEAYTMIDGTATENGYNYCPNCGADLRETETWHTSKGNAEMPKELFDKIYNDIDE